jgi:hypothetical protein
MIQRLLFANKPLLSTMKAIRNIFSVLLVKVSSITATSTIKLFVSLTVLTIINLFIFKDHYLGKNGFPWDFNETYLALPAYWISAHQNGIDPNWIPFQSMGYPLYMHFQSGYHYAPNWIFVLLGITYNGATAVILECIHVLFGALGVLFASRILNIPWRFALLAAASYHCFGGFYSNAQHVDIIRGFAYLPWVLAPLLVNKESPLLLARISLYITPIIVTLFSTGSYPGIIVSTLLIFICLGAHKLIFQNELRKHTLFCGIGLVIGLGLSSGYLLPTLLSAKEVARTHGTLNYEYLGLIDTFTTVFKIGYSAYKHDISMQSMSIGIIPVILLAQPIKQFNYKSIQLLIAAFIGLLIAAGAIHPYLIKIFPPAGLSRFTYSDYKGIIGLFLVFIAFSAPRPKNLNINFFLVFIILGAVFLNLTNEKNGIKQTFYIIAIGTASIFLLKKTRSRWAISLLLTLIVVDWARIHLNEGYYKSIRAELYLSPIIGEPNARKQKLLNEWRIPPESRPPRLSNKDAPITYRGYYDGSYMMFDYGGAMNLTRYQKIFTDPESINFATSSWAYRTSAPEKTAKRVLQKSYGTTKITYKIDSPTAFTFTENEVYWPGWSGIIEGTTELPIKPFDDKGFRSWSLPSGNYTFNTKFTKPYKLMVTWSVSISLFLLLSYLYLLFKTTSLPLVTSIDSGKSSGYSI